MVLKNNYPKLHIGGKTELAKHLSHKGFSKEEAQKLISNVLKNFDRYWKDNLKRSKPHEEKWVRSAKGTPLGFLLSKIDERLLAPSDELIPNYIFGGKRSSNHVFAVRHLQGAKGKRTLLKLDLRRFFEQITEDRVINLLVYKCGCSYKGAKLVARVCCVPFGKKGSNSSLRTIARGFSTSSRLAVWCSLGLFSKIDALIRARLKGKDPRIAIYVDDIGVTATKTKKSEMLRLAYEIKDLVEKYKHPLLINDDKREILRHDEGMEHLGIKMQRRGLFLGRKTQKKKGMLRASLIKNISSSDRKKLKRRWIGISQYERYVRSKNEKILPQGPRKNDS